MYRSQSGDVIICQLHGERPIETSCVWGVSALFSPCEVNHRGNRKAALWTPSSQHRQRGRDPWSCWRCSFRSGAFGHKRWREMEIMDISSKIVGWWVVDKSEVLDWWWISIELLQWLVVLRRGILGILGIRVWHHHSNFQTFREDGGNFPVLRVQLGKCNFFFRRSKEMRYDMMISGPVEDPAESSI